MRKFIGIITFFFLSLPFFGIFVFANAENLEEKVDNEYYEQSLVCEEVLSAPEEELFVEPETTITEKNQDNEKIDLPMPSSRRSVKPYRNVEKYYRVKSIKIEYSLEHRNHIPKEDLEKIQILLFRKTDRFTTPKFGELNKKYSLEYFEKMPTKKLISQNALRAMTKAIVNYYNKLGYQGIDVRVSENDINNKGEDIRKEGDCDLTFVIKTARIGEVKTIASNTKGEKFENHKRHKKMINNAPLKSKKYYSDEMGDLFNLDRLDDYLFYLNRHPRRRVDANIRPLLKEEIGLEFLINEQKPWVLWFNAANTGVPETEKYIESVGYVNNQFTNNDDIFRLFYSTDGFQNIHSVYGTYRIPISTQQKLSVGVNAGYNNFTSTELGIQDLPFTGEQVPASIEFIWTYYQYKNLFFDLVPSIEYKNIHVKNPVIEKGQSEISNTVGKQNFLFSQISLQIQRTEKWYRYFCAAGAIANPHCFTLGSNRAHLDNLGRNDISKDWYILQGDALVTFYIEPLLRNYLNWAPIKRGQDVLINEFAFRARGQWAFNYRLIPQEKAVIGGFNTVRGYPESIVSGDNYYVATAEYLLHLPRLLPPNKGRQKKLFGKPFISRPAYIGGATDWDLIFRGFFDIGRVSNNKRKNFEIDATLISSGFGFELLVWDNIIIRTDIGYVCNSISSLDIRHGASRTHFSATVLF